MDEPAMVKGLALFKELSTDGILDPGADGFEQYPDVNNAFLAGKVPMVQMGTWYQQNTEVSYLRANVEGLALPPARNCPPLSRSPSPTWVAILWRCSGPRLWLRGKH